MGYNVLVFLVINLFPNWFILFNFILWMLVRLFILLKLISWFQYQYIQYATKFLCRHCLHILATLKRLTATCYCAVFGILFKDALAVNHALAPRNTRHQLMFFPRMTTHAFVFHNVRKSWTLNTFQNLFSHYIKTTCNSEMIGKLNGKRFFFVDKRNRKLGVCCVTLIRLRR